MGMQIKAGSVPNEAEAPEQESKPERGAGLQVSGTQVAGSATATVVAAFLASSMGVYGTIIGAGVVSVGATAGGAVFQHMFRRTGEQIREVKVHAAPAAGSAAEENLAATQMLPQVGPEGETGYSEAETHGRRSRLRWKAIAITTLATFLLAMAAILGIEKLSGGPMSNFFGGDRTGTSWSPGSQGSKSGQNDPGRDDDTPAETPAEQPASGEDEDAAPSPSISESGDSGTTPKPDPSEEGSESPPPEESAEPTPPSETPAQDEQEQEQLQETPPASEAS